MVCIDFTKAFDSLHLHKLWNTLDKTPINKNYINLLKATYNGSEAAIKCSMGVSRFVAISKGVKQGDVLSAILFCVALAAVMLKTNQDCNSGYNIGGHILSNLSYADDIAAVDTNPTDLQNFINKLAEN